ncbi:MAG: hypothetical protein Q9164_007383, partial [Protoblastenia rupestris]
MSSLDPSSLNSTTPSNTDPLSTTASIVSILTFALGLLASYIALQSATRGAPSEIARLVDDLRSTQSEINRVAAYIFDDAHDTPAETTITRRFFVGKGGREHYAVGDVGSGVGGPDIRDSSIVALYEETQTLLGNCVRLFYEADDLLKRSRSDSVRWDPEGLRRRIVFVMNRHEVGEKMKRLGEQKVRLASVQM